MIEGDKISDYVLRGIFVVVVFTCVGEDALSDLEAAAASSFPISVSIEQYQCALQFVVLKGSLTVSTSLFCSKFKV